MAIRFGALGLPGQSRDIPHHQFSKLGHVATLRRLEQAAAVAAIAGLIVAAALPNSDDVASAAGGTTLTESARSLPPLARETAIGAYLGAPYHYPSDFSMTQDGRNNGVVNNVEWYTKPFDNPLYYGARVQQWFTGGRFGTMVDFTHSKAYAPFGTDTKLEGTLNGKPVPETAKLETLFKKLEFSHGHNMLTLNGLMRFASFGAIVPYAGVGAGVSLPHSEIHLSADPARTYEYQYTGPCAQALFGFEWRLKTGSVFIEYKFTLADYTAPITHTDGTWLPIDLSRQFMRWWSGEPPPGGFAAARLTSHQVISGFNVRFAPAVVATP